MTQSSFSVELIFGVTDGMFARGHGSLGHIKSHTDFLDFRAVGRFNILEYITIKNKSKGFVYIPLLKKKSNEKGGLICCLDFMFWKHREGFIGCAIALDKIENHVKNIVECKDLNLNNLEAFKGKVNKDDDKKKILERIEDFYKTSNNSKRDILWEDLTRLKNCAPVVLASGEYKLNECEFSQCLSKLFSYKSDFLNKIVFIFEGTKENVNADKSICDYISEINNNKNCPDNENINKFEVGNSEHKSNNFQIKENEGNDCLNSGDVLNSCNPSKKEKYSSRISNAEETKALCKVEANKEFNKSTNNNTIDANRNHLKIEENSLQVLIELISAQKEKDNLNKSVLDELTRSVGEIQSTLTSMETMIKKTIGNKTNGDTTKPPEVESNHKVHHKKYSDFFSHTIRKLKCIKILWFIILLLILLIAYPLYKHVDSSSVNSERKTEGESINKSIESDTIVKNTNSRIAETNPEDKLCSQAENFFADIGEKSKSELILYIKNPNNKKDSNSKGDLSLNYREFSEMVSDYFGETYSNESGFQEKSSLEKKYIEIWKKSCDLNPTDNRAD